ncbi:hypothetical protein GGS26DRAFT_602909 [Hypomontagnella submonticulosa]|nr:hypothetical protein GGS26DRAFT_602909 [Hypomontagnella submonticulosa]
MEPDSFAYHNNDSNVINQGWMEHSHVTSNVISQVTGNVTNNVINNVNHHYISDECKTPDRELNRYFGVPYVSSVYFTGRREMLEQLERCLIVGVKDQDTHMRSICVLYGLGGAGKTQLSVKFAEVYRDRFWGIFWVDAHSDNTAWHSFQKIARIAKVDRGQNVKEDAEQGKYWLAHQRKKWLLIIDGADNPNINVNNYMPPGGFGCLLVTTRNPYAVDSRSQFHIANLPIQDSIDLLTKIAGQAKETYSEDDIYKVTEIVKELDCLALAVVQAGCAIRNRSCRLDEYLEEFRRNRDDLMQKPAIQGTEDEKRTVYAAWMVSRAMIQELGSSQASDALDVLDISAFLYYGDIPLEIFKRIDPRDKAEPERMSWLPTSLVVRLTGLTPDHRKSEWPRSRLNNALSLLSSYSLISFDDNHASFSLHRLVHTWVRYHLKNELGPCDYRWAKFSASRGIASVVNTSCRGLDDFEFRRRLCPHITHYLGYDVHSHSLQPRRSEDAEILIKFAFVLEENGCYEKARDLYDKCSTCLEEALGKEHARTLNSLSYLGTVLEKLGHYDESESIHSRVLAARKKYLGLDHALTLQSIHNKTTALRGKGDIRGAMRLNEDLLRRQRLIMGNDDIATIEAMSMRASLCLRDGKYQEAAKFAGDALELRRRKLGESHRDTIGSIDDLVVILEHGGTDWDMAEEMSSKAVEMRMKAQGIEHPETLSSMSALARLLWKRGAYEKSKEIHMAVYTGRSQLLGSTHPDTLFTLSYLAEDSRRRGDYKEARKQLGEALAGLKQRFGEDHSHILILESNMAVICRQDQDLEEAEKMYWDLLGRHERMNGRTHPEAIRCLLNLSTLLSGRGDLTEAENYGREVVTGFREKLGRQHPDTLYSLYSLAKTLQGSKREGNLQEAEELAHEAHRGQISVLGPDHLDTLETAALLAHISHGRGRFHEAREQYANVCKRYTELRGSLNERRPWYFEYSDALDTKIKEFVS